MCENKANTRKAALRDGERKEGVGRGEKERGEGKGGEEVRGREK